MFFSLSNPATFRPELALTGLTIVLGVAVGLYASAVPQGRRGWWAAGCLLVALVIAALQVDSPLARTLLFDLATLAAVGLVWVQPVPSARPAARTYLLVMLTAMALTAAGQGMAGLLAEDIAQSSALPASRLAVALIIAGFAVKFALVPFFFWLPGLAASSSPMTTVLIISVLDMSEFGELIALRQHAPWIFTEHSAIWMGLAVCSMGIGALLALAQRDIKRMLAYSTIDDMGYLIVGILAGGSLGLTGALWGMFAHALSKMLLFGATGIVENTIREPLTLDCRGMSTHFPISGAMFITGALGILGIPPLPGFAGRFRLYQSGYLLGGPLLMGVMMAATGLALIYYVRAIHQVWLGRSPGQPVSVTRSEPRLAVAVLIVVAGITLLLGLAPGLLQAVL